MSDDCYDGLGLAWVWLGFGLGLAWIWLGLGFLAGMRVEVRS